jgi:hypothetical protein
MDIDKLFESESLDGIADNVFGVVNNSVSEVKEMQRKKVAENVQLVVNALKKIESDISSRYDSVGNALEKRIITIKDGRDGADGSDGRNGRDGKNGRDGAPGPRGADGKNGLDGADGTDGVSVTNAHIDFDGSLVISLSSGHELNVGEVVAPALAEQIKVITNGGGTSQSVIDTLASLQAQITAISGASIYKGLWNASTNTPTLTSSVGTSGNFYIVSVAGSTNLNGITNWGVGDWAIYNGTAWQRVEGGAAGNFTTVTASSLTSGRVTYAGTAGLLQDSANLTFNGTTLTANTIGAFTLGGTVSGGGNQLNNVIIGTTTPLAGAFTTLSATGTITSSGGLIRSSVTGAVNAVYSAFQGGVIEYSFGLKASNSHFVINNGGNFGGTDLLDISSTGLAVTNTIGVGGTAPSASGAGITFPATQSASSDANTLDDYEEGTWTPNIDNGYNSANTVTYTAQNGTYTKIGRLVVAAFNIQINTWSGNAGPVFFGGLPFSMATTTDARFQGTVYLSGPNTPASTVTVTVGYGKMDNGSYYLVFNCSRDDTAMANAGTLQGGDFAAGDVIAGTLTYFTT